jgi:hypothetical protein
LAKDASRSVKIVDDELVIRVGINTLAWAFDHMLENNPYSDKDHDFVQKWRVSDPLEFTKDTVSELLREEEDGTTPLDLLFDKVMNNAVDQGSLGIEEVTDHKSAYTRDYEEENKNNG